MSAARAVAVLLVCAVLPAAFGAPLAAASYGWDGGHDLMGWPAPARAIYFAEGTTRNGFEEYLIIRNPAAVESVVTVNYLFGSGAPKAQHLTIAPRAAVSINVNGVVGPDMDVSVALAAEPGVIAEREIYFNYKGVWTGGHVTRGVPSPSDTWYLAEGTTRAGFQEWLCLQNPGAIDAAATLTYMLGTGENRREQLVIPAGSRRTIDVNSSLGPEQDVSILVEASAPLVAERPMYFDYKNAWRGGHTATGSSRLARAWDFAEGTTRPGFEEWLCIMNPGEEATARVEYMFPGEPSLVKEYPLKARARTTIFVNEAVGPEKDVSIRVTSGRDILCERPMYFLYRSTWEGGHDVLGSTAGEKTWYFPVSGAGMGFISWLCLMNPGELANRVRMEVFGEGGAYIRRDLKMAPRSRATLDLNTASEGMAHPWVKVSGTSELVAERPTYFSYEPRVEPRPFAFATWAGMELKSPIRYNDNIGAVFHEASAAGGDGGPSNPQAMQPLGICLRDDNPSRLAPGLSRSVGNATCYFIEDSRARGTWSTTACDVCAKAGTTVYAPVSGTVITAAGYMLYGKYPDVMVEIAIDGHPGYQVALLHMSQALVVKGQRVEGGLTPVGIVRDLVPYFHSGPNPYTREEGNHVHMQVNHRAGSGLSGEPPTASGAERSGEQRTRGQRVQRMEPSEPGPAVQYLR